VELRQLEAFVAVANELHFGRAAQKLHMGQPALSAQVQRLERELGAPLMVRTTRRVALTGAGSEFLRRAKVILDEVGSACAAVHRVAQGHAGAVRVGITPPVAPVLAPHLAAALQQQAPDVELIVRRMWLPDLERALADGRVDVAITCGVVPDPPGVIGKVFCGEPLLVSVRADHRLAGRDAVALADLVGETRGIHNSALFPAWTLAHLQALEAAGVLPPTAELVDTDLFARHWAEQPEVDWILTTASLVAPETSAPMRPVTPAQALPYTLQWNPARAASPAVGRFVHLALSVDVPSGWVTQPDHLHHRDAAPKTEGQPR
jgi:DNA-binding transcriptional LysR family regulator